jgi:hypothetical protein
LAQGAAIGEGEDDHHVEPDIGEDALPTARSGPLSRTNSPALGDAPAGHDEGQDTVETSQNPPATRRRSNRRRVIFVAGIIVVGTAAGAIAVSQSHPDAPVPAGEPDLVIYGVTGSTHSSSIRYRVGDGTFQERTDLDLVLPSPYDIELSIPPGAPYMVEARNASPAGDVGCTVTMWRADGSQSKWDSALNTSVATCAGIVP